MGKVKASETVLVKRERQKYGEEMSARKPLQAEMLKGLVGVRGRWGANHLKIMRKGAKDVEGGH